jgi:hypothetical protein
MGEEEYRTWIIEKTRKRAEAIRNGTFEGNPKLEKLIRVLPPKED